MDVGVVKTITYFVDHFYHAAVHQIWGMSPFGEGFFSTTYPAEHTIHWWSGLSGIFYILPIFSTGRHRMSLFGKFFWLTQALFSCLADYFYMGHVSAVHGIDRYLAVLNMFRSFAVGVQAGMWSHMTLAVIPLGSHLLARIAKREERWAEWIFLHGMWHVSGCLVIYFCYCTEHTIFEARRTVVGDGSGEVRVENDYDNEEKETERVYWDKESSSSSPVNANRRSARKRTRPDRLEARS